MLTLRFEGYSDDTFGEYGATNDDYDNCASGEPIEYLVQDPVTGLAVIVTGQHCPGKSTGWLIGVSNGNDNAPFPAWPMRFEPQDQPYGDEVRLVIEAPGSVAVRCLTREQNED
jgi:hypothetical protein